MKNAILTFDREELDEFIVPDYFSKDIKISDFTDNLNPDYFDIYHCADNDKLERISFELYGTTKYWDIIFLINKRDPLFDLPYSFDILENESERLLEDYLFNIYSHAPLTSEPVVTALRENITRTNLEDNEQFRMIRVVKRSKINDFIKLLKTNGYI